RRGCYVPASLTKEGFIHFSTAEQVLRVANAFYRGAKALLLLEVEVEALKAPVRWEAPAGALSPDSAGEALQERFPHLYGALNLEAVRRVLELLPEADGSFPRLPL
ncbi:MAG: DUF952 domain-containing protein, partial [Anaerolineales bacterium]|nr:DUF952 domain-containing protein [Anaerolineales bacterium]MDW8226765.1 DUF952 domain-containing protein [Anaerolineales bacterium]